MAATLRATLQCALFIAPASFPVAAAPRHGQGSTPSDLEKALRAAALRLSLAQSDSQPELASALSGLS